MIKMGKPKLEGLEELEQIDKSVEAEKIYEDLVNAAERQGGKAAIFKESIYKQFVTSTLNLALKTEYLRGHNDGLARAIGSFKSELLVKTKKSSDG